jgi:hypothetical protein
MLSLLSIVIESREADVHTDEVATDLERAIQRLQDLRFEVGAQVVWLADRAGHVLAEAGMIERVVPGEMVDVVNRSFDSSLQLVQQLREDRSFNLVYHEGARFDIYSSNIDHERFIVLVFDRRQGPNRIGIVWLYTKRAVQDLYNLLVHGET